MGEEFAYFAWVTNYWPSLMRCFPIYGSRVLRDRWRGEHRCSNNG